MFIDMYYIVLVLPAIIFAMFAQASVNNTFKKYSKAMTSNGVNGADAAEAVLKSNGIYNVRIERVQGTLTDHYDPKTNVIRLSDSVYDNSSVAAVGVAAHEAGHAVQYAQNYAFVKLRMAIIPVSQIGSTLSGPLIILGLILGLSIFMELGVIFFFAALLFQLITLPVELNASKRAIQALHNNAILSDSELPGAKKTLRAAAMTYVAALAVSLAQFLRLLLIVSGNRRND